MTPQAALERIAELCTEAERVPDERPWVDARDIRVILSNIPQPPVTSTAIGVTLTGSDTGANQCPTP